MIFDRVATVSFSGVNINPITDLRITFSVEKHDDITFNSASISIYNLPKRVRKKLARTHPSGFKMVQPVIVGTLSAGYKGNEVQLFDGDLLSATNRRVGPNWQTNLYLMSGYYASTIATSRISISGKTPAKSIVKQLLTPLKIHSQYTLAADEKLKNKFVTDFSTSSLSYRAVSEFLNRYGLSFTLEEAGQGLIYDSKKPRDPNTGKTLDNNFSPKNGMIGSPEITMTGIYVRSLLRPNLRLFQKFFVESETVSSTLIGGDNLPVNEYQAVNITHSGDNRGNEWFTEIEGTYFDLIDGAYGDSV